MTNVTLHPPSHLPPPSIAATCCLYVPKHSRCPELLTEVVIQKSCLTLVGSLAVLNQIFYLFWVGFFVCLLFGFLGLGGYVVWLVLGFFVGFCFGLIFWLQVLHYSFPDAGLRILVETH